MVVAPSNSEWSDGRLNELALRVERAATKEEISGLRRELTERSEVVNSNVDRIGRKIDEITGDPFSEARQKRAAIMVAIFAALSGGALSTILYLLVGATPH